MGQCTLAHPVAEDLRHDDAGVVVQDRLRREANGRRVFAMEISPAYVDVDVERWQAETGHEAILDGDGRTFAQVRIERLEDKADATA